MCRRLLRSGLDPCLEPGREEKSKSVLFAWWTSGLVGGKKVNEPVDDCDVARALETARESGLISLSKECGIAVRDV